MNFLSRRLPVLALVASAAAIAAGPILAQDRVTVMSSISGDMGRQLEDMFDVFTAASGIEVVHEGVGDFETQIYTRIESGNPPDVAFVPQPGTVNSINEVSNFVDLKDVLTDGQLDSYPAPMLELVRDGDAQPALMPWGLINSSIWYNRAIWESGGYEVPETYDDLVALSEQMVGDGLTPWCVAVESSVATGWMLGDWIQDIVMNTHGQDVFNEWANGEMPFSDSRIKAAFEEAGRILLRQDFVYGGKDRILSTPWEQQSTPMFGDDPGCVMSHIPSFGIGSFPEAYRDNVDEYVGTFLFPTSNPDMPRATVTNGGFVGILNDTPEARALMEFVASPSGADEFLRQSGFLPVNAMADSAILPNELLATHAKWFRETPQQGYNAVDRFPTAKQLAAWQGFSTWIANDGEDLDEILATIDAALE